MTVHPPTPGPQGPFAIKICRCMLSTVHPPPASLPVGCGRGRMGGQRAPVVSHPAATVLPEQAVSVQRRRDQISYRAGACVPEARSTVRPGFIRRMRLPKKQEGVPRKWGPGGDAYEHWRKPSAHRRRPPVTLWFLSGDTERKPPRRAEPFSKKVLLSAPPRPTAARWLDH